MITLGTHRISFGGRPCLRARPAPARLAPRSAAANNARPAEAGPEIPAEVAGAATQAGDAAVEAAYEAAAAKARGSPASSPPPGTEASSLGKKPLTKDWVQEVLGEITDTSQLGTRGEGWFAAQLLAFLLVIFPPASLKPLVDAAGWLGVLAGLGMMFLGQQVLGQNLTPWPKPRENNELVQEGIFSLCRHPMYGGLCLCALGLSLATGNEVRLVMALATCFVLSEKATYEERFLEEKHPQYGEYRKKTWKLIPYIF